MEQFNKALSFILGLVVVAVFIIVASGKFNIKGLNLAKSVSKAKITPTVTPTPAKKGATTVNKVTTKTTSKPTTNTQVTKQVDPNFHSYSGSTVPTSIPNTGVPIVMFPLLGSSLLTGILMKRSQKKD
ncbi:MAG: hypothetical protein WAV30_02710 [Microgenomates group bacterium]